MAWRNGWAGQTDGQTVTIANSAASGSALGQVVYGNVAVGTSGNANVTYELAAGAYGAIGVEFGSLPAPANYLRVDDVSETGPRFVSRIALYMQGTPAAAFSPITMRSSSTFMSSLFVGTDLKVYAQRVVTTISGSTSAEAIPATGWVVFHLAVTKETGGGGNGVVEYKVTNLAGADLVTPYVSAATQAVGATDVAQVRFGGASNATGWTTMWLGDGAFASAASGWIANPANVAPTVSIGANQSVPAGSTINLTVTASDSDGSIASYSTVVTRYSNGAAPANVTVTDSGTDHPSWTAGAAGTLDVVVTTATDNLGTPTSASVEYRVLSGATPVSLLYSDGSGDSGWSIVGGSATQGAALGDVSDSTKIESPDITSTPSERRWRYIPMQPRTGFRVTLEEAELTVAGTYANKVRIYCGSTLITERATSTLKKVSDDSTADFSTTATDLYFDLTPSEITAITDWGNLQPALVVAT